MKPIEPSATGKEDKLGRILGAEEELLPSSGFVAAVMERVREEAIAPKPIPFPWRRVLPGGIVVAAGLIWCVVQLVRMVTADAGGPAPVQLHPAALMTPRVESAGWAAAALGVSALSWLLARRLAGRRGLV